MAEGLLRKMLADEGLRNIEVKSAGVAAWGNSPVSDHAATVLSGKGCAVSGRATALTAEQVKWASLILTMTSSHKRHTIQLYPEAVDKVFTLKEYVQEQRHGDPWSELESFVSELQLKQALAEPITEEERRKLRLLEQDLPSLDIVDPFGGSLRQYEACAQEIEACLRKLISQWKAS